MRYHEFNSLLFEGLNHPCIVVDCQPEYARYGGYEYQDICDNIIHFVNEQRGPVLMFINAEETGTSRDTKNDVLSYWEETVLGNTDPADFYDASGGESPIDWNRFTIVDKGYGYLRSWMDHDVSPHAIIKVIRLMYQSKVSDSRDLFGGEESDNYEINMKELLGHDFIPMVLYDQITVNWTSIAQLKRFSGAYLVGGGRNECLREVELLMNAFNIKYKRIDSLVYG